MTDIAKGLDKSRVVARLHELIEEMSEEEQRDLLSELEEKAYQKKREHERKPFPATVDYSTAKGAYRDFIKDISDGGVFIETPRPHSIGERISMTFLLPEHEKRINVQGVIVRVDEGGIGVKFETSQVQQEIIKLFVDKV
ncbi:MAG: PilZ domain-containing protein [Deltaproteobacteria bacterium]|nr:PilZ domain-containing protein [Deltaproteobacteria bacterium]